MIQLGMAMPEITTRLWLLPRSAEIIEVEVTPVRGPSSIVGMLVRAQSQPVDFRAKQLYTRARKFAIVLLGDYSSLPSDPFVKSWPAARFYRIWITLRFRHAVEPRH